MAIKYVDSTATGANDGTSWADAYTEISSVASSSAGDEIRVSHTDTQTLGGTLNMGGSVANPIKMYSINKATDAWSAGAIIVSNGQSIDGNIRVSGFINKTNGNLSLGRGVASKARQYWEDCELQKTGTGTGDLIYICGAGPDGVDFVRCAFTQSSTGKWTGFRMEGSGKVTCTCCTFAMDFSQAIADTYNGNASGLPCIYEFYDCDLSQITNLWYTVHDCNHIVYCRRCRIHASLTVSVPSNTSDLQEYLLEDCASGTLSVPPVGLTNYTTYRGQITPSLSVYRTGGADDGVNANAHSWKIVSSANCRLLNPIKTPLVGVWVPGGGSITVTAYIAGGATLYDDEAWLEIEGPDNAGSPSAMGYCADSRMALRGTHAAAASDSSTWNGSGVGTVQKLELAYTPTLAGWVTGRVCVGKASATVYFDPKLAVSGITSTYQRFFSRSQVMGPNESGVGGGGLLIGGGMTGGFHRT